MLNSDLCILLHKVIQVFLLQSNGHGIDEQYNHRLIVDPKVQSEQPPAKNRY